MSRNNDVIPYVTLHLNGRIDEITRRLYNRGKSWDSKCFFPLPFVNMPTLKHSEMQIVELGINGRL